MFREPEEKKVVETYILADAPTDANEVKTDVQKCSGAKYTSGPFQCESSYSSSSTKTNLIQNGLKICFANQNNLLFIIKYLPTNVIKSPSIIWRWDEVQGYNLIIIR